MRCIKTLVPLLVSAVALMALSGVGTATATVLCKNNLNTEKCSEPYPVGTEFKTTLVEPALMTAGFKNIACGKASGEGKLESEGSSSATPGGKGTGTYSECNCSVVVASTGVIEVHHIAGTDNGTVTFTGSTVTTSCSTIFGAVHCNYVTNNTDMGTLEGGNPATVTFTAEIPREATNSLCNEQALLHAKFRITTPSPLYVAAS